ncbi:hypothetical protein V8B97DRAFT_1862800 [Scleroderma yunnanense]
MNGDHPAPLLFLLMTQESPSILNPVIYLNYLSPSIASDYETSRDLGLATLGALFWDILSSIPEDCKLICTGRVSSMLLAYFLARLSSLIMVVLAILQKTGPVSNCLLIGVLLVGCQVISSATVSYLFLKHVHIVYYSSKIGRHIFSFLWIVGVGTSCLVFCGVLHDISEIADTKHCVLHSIWSALFIPFLDPVLFDILVYFAITYKILTTHQMGKKKGWKYYCYGTALPHLSWAVWQEGQQDYLITTGINMSWFVFSLVPSISPMTQVFLSDPAVSLTSVMACQVYQNLIIESLHDLEGMGGVIHLMRAGQSMMQQPKLDSQCKCNTPKEEV